MKQFIDKQTYQSIVAGNKHLTDNNQLIVTGQTFPAIVKCNNKTFVAMSNVVMQVDNDIEDVSQLYWVPNWQTFKTSCKPSEFEMHCRFEDALQSSASFAANFELHCMQQYLKLWNIDLGFDKSLSEVSMPMLLKQLGMLGSQKATSIKSNLMQLQCTLNAIAKHISLERHANTVNKFLMALQHQQHQSNNINNHEHFTYNSVHSNRFAQSKQIVADTWSNICLQTRQKCKHFCRR